MRRTVFLAIAAIVSICTGCVSSPMLIGPPRTMSTQGTNLTAGAIWKKPVDSASFGAPQLDGAYHIGVMERFDLVARLWTGGAGMQGRIALTSRDAGAGLNLMLAPLLGVGMVVGLKQEERFLPPIEAEFLLQVPLIAGFGAGSCEIFAGANPLGHLKPGRAVLRGAGVLGMACPTEAGSWIAPEISFEAPLLGGAELKPDGNDNQGVVRHPLVATVVTAGLTFSF